MHVQNVSVSGSAGGHASEFLGWHRAVNLQDDPAHAPPIPERACATAASSSPERACAPSGARIPRWETMQLDEVTS